MFCFRPLLSAEVSAGEEVQRAHGSADAAQVPLHASDAAPPLPLAGLPQPLRQRDHRKRVSLLCN